LKPSEERLNDCKPDCHDVQRLGPAAFVSDFEFHWLGFA